MQGVSLKFLWQRQQFARVHGSSGPIEELLRTSIPDAIGYTALERRSLGTKILEARVGFEPTNGGFADLSLGPLGYRAKQSSIANRALTSFRSAKLLSPRAKIAPLLPVASG